MGPDGAGDSTVRHVALGWSQVCELAEVLDEERLDALRRECYQRNDLREPRPRDAEHAGGFRVARHPPIVDRPFDVETAR